MVDLSYWVETFLSTTEEQITAVIVLTTLGGTAAYFSDSRDTVAAVLGSALLFLVLGVAGFRFFGEWHYWLLGGSILVLMILVVDSKRKR
ncbi:MAG: hypothetical protein ABEJ58_08885 [Halodesulfurarchaeum sp.]